MPHMIESIRDIERLTPVRSQEVQTQIHHHSQVQTRVQTHLTNFQGREMKGRMNFLEKSHRMEIDQE